MAERGPGLRVRLSRAVGLTPGDVLVPPLYLPVALGEFSFDEEFSHSDYLGPFGEFSQPAPGGPTARSLRSSDIETLTLDWEAPWMTGGFTDPQEARRVLYRLARSKRPFDLLATVQFGRPEELRMRATIRGISRVLRPGEADTRYMTIRLREWRDNRVRRLSSLQGRDRNTGGRLPASHPITARDTLHSITRIYYGSTGGWRDVANANGITNWGPGRPLVEMGRFKAGDKIVVPQRVGFLPREGATSPDHDPSA